MSSQGGPSIPWSGLFKGAAYAVAAVVFLGVAFIVWDEASWNAARMKDRLLFAAVDRGDLQAVKDALASGRLEPNSRGRGGRTVLMHAAQAGAVDVALLLIEKGARVADKDDGGRDALGYAAEGGNAAMAGLLLDRGADPNVGPPAGFTPLRRSVFDDSTDIALLLIERGADADAKDGDGKTALAWAAINGSTAMVKVLLDAGANPELGDRIGWTPLMQAADRGFLPVAELLLARGAKAGARDPSGAGAWLLAAYGPHPDIQALLEKSGARREELVPMDAVGKDQAEELAAAKARGANLNARIHQGSTLLIAACWKQAGSVAKYLLDNGADVNAVDQQGFTALIAAAQKGDAALAGLLLDRGADPELTGHSSALHYARSMGHKDVARLIESRRSPRTRSHP